MKIYHTPETAAQAVRAMFESDNRIAKTWEQYFEQQRESSAMRPAERPMGGSWLNSYLATMLVQEQCNGPQKYAGAASHPITFEIASDAVAAVIPELFAEYWEGLPLNDLAIATT